MAPINNYSSIDTAEYSSTAVQQYNSTAPAGEQDCRFHTAHAERWSADSIAACCLDLGANLLRELIL